MTHIQQKAFEDWMTQNLPGPTTLRPLCESAFTAGMTAGRAEAVAEIAAMLREWSETREMIKRPLMIATWHLRELADHIENREKKP